MTTFNQQHLHFDSMSIATILSVPKNHCDNFLLHVYIIKLHIAST
jgi:hypothetical protein